MAGLEWFPTVQPVSSLAVVPPGRISTEDSCLCWGLGQNSTLRRGYIGGLVLYWEVTFPQGLACASTHYSTAPVRGAANPSTGRDPQQLFCLEEPLPVSRGAELWGTITVKPCWDKRARLSNSHEVSSGVLSTLITKKWNNLLDQVNNQGVGVSVLVNRFILPVNVINEIWI